MVPDDGGGVGGGVVGPPVVPTVKVAVAEKLLSTDADRA
jgi:hypothetical protein